MSQINLWAFHENKPVQNIQRKVKVSCMPSIAAKIRGHKKKQQLEQEETETFQKKCNCIMEAQCSLDGLCQTSGIVYEATVSTEQDDANKCICLAETSLKVSYASHKTSFDNEKAGTAPSCRNIFGTFAKHTRSNT